MIGFLIRTAATAITFAIVAYLYDGISYGDSIPTLIVVALIAGAVNGFVRPIVELFALPLTLTTYGLFGLVLNAAALLAIAFVANLAGFEFTVGGFPPDFGLSTIVAAVVASVALSIVGSIVHTVVRD